MKFEMHPWNSSIRSDYELFIRTLQIRPLGSAPEWLDFVQQFSSPHGRVFLAVIDSDREWLAVLPFALAESNGLKFSFSLPISCPYGGPYRSRHTSPGVLRPLLQGVLRWLKDRQVVTFTLIESPFLEPAEREILREELRPDFQLDRETQIIDLTSSLNFKPSVHQDIARAQKRGVSVRRGTSDMDFTIFYGIYKDNIERLGFRVKPQSWFEYYRTVFKEDHLLLVAEEAGSIFAGLVCLNTGGVTTLMENVYLPEAKLLHGPTFLNYDAILRCKHKNQVYYNFGASPARDSGIFRFKSKFSPAIYPFSYLNCIMAELPEKEELLRIRHDLPLYFIYPDDLILSTET